MSIAKNIEWYEKRLNVLEKALNKACEIIAHNFELADCLYCSYYDQGCTKNIIMNADGTFDCDFADWWKEHLLKEM